VLKSLNRNLRKPLDSKHAGYSAKDYNTCSVILGDKQCLFTGQNSSMAVNITLKYLSKQTKFSNISTFCLIRAFLMFFEPSFELFMPFGGNLFLHSLCAIC
jgi:hypothetical protein